MSDEYVDDGSDDISNSLAAECTGTVGMPDDAAADGPLYESMASAVEAYDEHEALKDREPEELVEEDEQPRKGSGKVPLGALREERAKRQQLQQQLDAQAQQLAIYQQQLAQFQQYQQQLAQTQQQQAQLEPEIDPEIDPVGFIRAKEKQFTEQLQNVQYQQQYQQAVVQLQQEQQQLAPVVAQAEEAFAESVGVENYRAAFEAVHQTIQANMRQQHPNASPQEMALIEQTVNVAFVRRCQAEGINPAEHIYNRAIEMGLVSAVPGQRVPGTRLPPKAPTSLSTLSANGRAPDQRGAYKAGDIANLSNDEFNRLFESMRDTQRPAV
ncbi:hypothetical protein [Pseudomonas umsongensis]|uniref:Uncharacterized protein n=1 Tax=Pseudomonas umsongensis TaxID=198618 RepID=A0AAE6ZUG3_9PSED|nr:hypothetical protein [Pseudomonas umsongensis]QJC78216.1 hypothetical protein HGP31_07800 [Pseudomonas umsongensis]